MEDDDFETYENEELPDYRLRDGVDLAKLRLGEGQEFEVEVDNVPKGKVSFDVSLTGQFLCSLRVVQCINNVISSVKMLKVPVGCHLV